MDKEGYCAAPRPRLDFVLVSCMRESSSATYIQSNVKTFIPARFRECLAEILRQSVILGWAAEDFESDSRNLSRMFLHNSIFLVLNFLTLACHYVEFWSTVHISQGNNLKGVAYSDTPVTGCDMYNKQGILMIINAINCKCTGSTVIIHGLDTISIAQ